MFVVKSHHFGRFSLLTIIICFVRLSMMQIDRTDIVIKVSGCDRYESGVAYKLTGDAHTVVTFIIENHSTDRIRFRSIEHFQFSVKGVAIDDSEGLALSTKNAFDLEAKKPGQAPGSFKHDCAHVPFVDKEGKIRHLLSDFVLYQVATYKSVLSLSATYKTVLSLSSCRSRYAPVVDFWGSPQAL